MVLLATPYDSVYGACNKRNIFSDKNHVFFFYLLFVFLKD